MANGYIAWVKDLEHERKKTRGPLHITHRRRKKGMNRGVRRIISDSRASPLGKLVEVWEWRRMTYRAIIPAQLNIQKMTNPALPNLAIS